MTREEAITYLNVIWNRYKAEYEIERETLDAYHMAIEALSQPIVAKHFDIQNGYIYCSPQIAENVKVVVRCKDCRHRYEEGDNTHYYWCRLNDRPIDDTDYCAWAERREP